MRSERPSKIDDRSQICTKPGPDGLRNASRRCGEDCSGWPSASQVSGSFPPSALSATGSFSRLPFRRGQFDLRIRGGISDAQGRLAPRPSRRVALLLTERAQGRRKVLGLSDADDIGGRPGERRAVRADGAKQLEQHRRRNPQAHEPRHRGCVRPANPNRDRIVSVEARRPGVAEAGRGAGLEGDAPLAQADRQRGEAFGQRRVGQDVGDVPGGGRPERRTGALAGRGALWRGELPPLASPRRARPSPAARRWRCRALCRVEAPVSPAAGRRTPAVRRVGDEALRPDLLERQHRRHVQRLLQRARTVTAP